MRQTVFGRSQQMSKELSENQLSYIGHLQLDRLLSCLQPLSTHPEEHIFITTHHSLEIWFCDLTLTDVNFPGNATHSIADFPDSHSVFFVNNRITRRELFKVGPKKV